MHTLVQPSISFLLHDPPDRGSHALLVALLTSNVGLRLDRDVRVRHRRREEFAQGAQEESDGWCHAALFLHSILHLLKERILQNGVDDEHQCGQNTGKESLWAFVAKQGHDCCKGAGRLGRFAARSSARGSSLFCIPRLCLLFNLVLPCSHSCIDDPDRVGHDNCRRTGNGTGNHALDGGELFCCATGLFGGTLEKGACVLVKVVVYEVGYRDTKNSGVEACVETGEAFAVDDGLDGFQEGRVGALGFNLGAGGEGDEGVAGDMMACGSVVVQQMHRCRLGGGNVRKDHRQDATAGSSKSVSHIVVLGYHGLGRGGGHLV